MAADKLKPIPAALDEARAASSDRTLVEMVDKARVAIVQAGQVVAGGKDFEQMVTRLEALTAEVQGHRKTLHPICYPETPAATTLDKDATCNQYQGIRAAHQIVLEGIGLGAQLKGGNENSFRVLVEKVQEISRLTTDSGLREALGAHAAAGWDPAKLKDLVAKETPVSQWPTNVKISQLCGIKPEPGLS